MHHYGYIWPAYPYRDDVYMPVIRYGQAYVPYQRYRCFFPLPEGFHKGTIFQELYDPYQRKPW
ncbi:conserved hypothetical protein [Thermincola potens JR]|uniref:Spore coat associated protein CotJA n=1 Tax=Thermincola potens (strain JR) TaxID=635013 RepID=D5XAM6_THEPJ|nr:conserved hypothetical protein [Thermincola potens JR]